MSGFELDVLRSIFQLPNLVLCLCAMWSICCHHHRHDHHYHDHNHYYVIVINRNWGATSFYTWSWILQWWWCWYVVDYHHCCGHHHSDHISISDLFVRLLYVSWIKVSVYACACMCVCLSVCVCGHLCVSVCLVGLQLFHVKYKLDNYKDKNISPSFTIGLIKRRRKMNWARSRERAP